MKLKMGFVTLLAVILVGVVISGCGSSGSARKRSISPGIAVRPEASITFAPA